MSGIFAAIEARSGYGFYANATEEMHVSALHETMLATNAARRRAGRPPLLCRCLGARCDSELRRYLGRIRGETEPFKTLDQVFAETEARHAAERAKVPSEADYVFAAMREIDEFIGAEA